MARKCVSLALSVPIAPSQLGQPKQVLKRVKVVTTNTCTTWLYWHFSVGAFFGFDHGEGLRHSPRPLGFGV